MKTGTAPFWMVGDPFDGDPPAVDAEDWFGNAERVILRAPPPEVSGIGWLQVEAYGGLVEFGLSEPELRALRETCNALLETVR